MSKKEEIRDFLIFFKKVINEKSNKKLISGRGDNKSTMEILEYTYQDVFDELKNLTVENYMSGPMDPEKEILGGQVWEFGTFVKDNDIYIKIHLYEDGIKYYLLCISFHFSSKRMNLPYLYS